MAKRRERGTGSVYLPDDPNHPGRKLRTWWISYYIDGRRKRESSKSRKKSDAQALLRRRTGEHVLGLEIGEEAKRLTFEDLEAGFRRSYENSGRRSLRRAGTAWDRLRDHFGGWRARAITANALESYAAERLREAAPATVRYELAVLRRAMSLAVRKGQLRSRPHFPHVGVHNARTGFFTREEMERIASRIGPQLENLVRVAFWTGWRQGELLNLKWADVDWAAGVLRLRPTSTIAGTTTKNNDGRVFPFRPLPQLDQALRAQRAYTDDVARRTGTITHYVFHREGNQIREFRTAWLSACKAAGVKLSRDRVFHSMRASAARNITAAGIPERVAMQLMGHKTRSMFERYSITTEGDLHEAVGRLSGAAPEHNVMMVSAYCC
jgi:integrase